MQHRFVHATVSMWLPMAGIVASGQVAATESGNATQAIEAAVRSYVTAFNAEDASKLAAHWSPEGVYVSKTSGEQLVGRDAIAADFAMLFADESAMRLAVATESIDFLSPNVAIERGTATVSNAEDKTHESRYSAVYVNRDGRWLIDRVSEEDVFRPPSHYEQLKHLEWLIGEWVDETGEQG